MYMSIYLHVQYYLELQFHLPDYVGPKKRHTSLFLGFNSPALVFVLLFGKWLVFDGAFFSLFSLRRPFDAVSDRGLERPQHQGNGARLSDNGRC